MYDLLLKQVKMEKLLTPDELGRILNVKLSTIYKYTHMGTIPFYKIGKMIRFKEDEIMNWVEKKAVKNKHTRVSNIQ